MDPRLFGEFMGTLVLVLIGNGVVANVVLKKTLGSAAGWLTIVFGYGLAVVAGVFVAIACGSGDAQIPFRAGIPEGSVWTVQPTPFQNSTVPRFAVVV